MGTLASTEIPPELFKRLGENARQATAPVDGMQRSVARLRGTDFWLSLDESTDPDWVYVRLTLWSGEKFATGERANRDADEIATVLSLPSEGLMHGPIDLTGNVCVIQVSANFFEGNELNVRSPAFAAYATIIDALRAIDSPPIA